MKPDAAIWPCCPFDFTTIHSRIATALLIGLALMTPAHAQDASAAARPAPPSTGTEVLDQVVVTARKRDEKQIDVPISVQSFSEKEIRAAGIYNIRDLKSYAGFEFIEDQGTGPGGRTFGVLTFRGLSGDTGQQFENSGAIFLDGIFISGGVSSLSTTDVARIEVLKGPQNAFFGRSTFGGAVNFITKNPSNTFKGAVDASYGSLGSNDESLTLEGPLATNLVSGRLTLANHDKAGSYKAQDGGELGREKTKSIDTTLYITPTDKVWVRLRGHYQQDDDSAPQIGFLKGTTYNSCVGQYFPGTNRAGVSQPFTPANPYICGFIPSLKQTGNGVLDSNTIMPASVVAAFTHNSLGDPFQSLGPNLDHVGMRRDTLRVSAQAGVDLPYDSQFAFNVGYNKSNSNTIYDLDRGPLLNFINETPLLTSDLTMDARLSSDAKLPLRGLLGASYFHQRYRFSQIDLNAAFAATAPTVNLSNYIDNKSDVPAVYGSVEYDILSNLTISGDARYQIDKTTSYTRVGGLSYENEKKNWLPRLTLRYKPTDDLAFYGNVAKGVQPLSLNAGYINAPSAAAKAYLQSIVPGTTEYSPQPVLVSSEIGVKQRLLDDRVQYSFDFYNELWRHRITSAFIFNPPSCTAAQQLTPPCPLSLSGSSIAFGNDAHIRGIEFSVDAIILKNWTAGLYLDYKDPKWQHYYNSSLAALTGTTVQFDGNTLGKVPKWNAAFNTTVRTPLPIGWDGYTRADVKYTGTAYDTDFNVAKTSAFFRTNLRAGIEKKDTTIELYVKNLFDDKHWDSVTRTADLTFAPLTNFNRQGLEVQAPDRREVGVRLHYGFD